ncbi:conserved hypothetical protein [Gloeothece citriformis PCC 7424]|uniref:Cyanobacterial membrane protein, in cluster with PxcA n=1 Tax=Gloeothece citriformis (strain PCC 7424) TaxID=65393 RepID=B7KHV6_GLOC7|nr:hypothetical protein [Gloeothece citriformis]ACK72053.1 conserved hypothetical protein [Gloeothece citriformis PCC 7424]
MSLLPIWFIGTTRSGKTTHLVKQFCLWIQEKALLAQKSEPSQKQPQQLASAMLIFAANDDNRSILRDHLSLAVSGRFPINCKTPLGFITDEVMLFWPLLFETLNLKAQFPIRLRPETEQELATRLWRPHLEQTFLQQAGVSEYRFVRRTLDLMQLAGAAGIAVEDIPVMLEQGLSETLIRSQWPGVIRPEQLADNFVSSAQEVHEAHRIGQLILEWREWCLERGLLSYGLIYELYWRYLLPNPNYQGHLISRYQAIFADDVDDYPAIARELFDFLLAQGAHGVFTYNPDGQVRLGLGADPNYLAELASSCEIIDLSPKSGLASQIGETVIEMVTEPLYINSLPEEIQSLQTTSRAQMLRKTAEVIIDLIKKEDANPSDIAVIAPGLDEIARYALREILTTAGIPVEPLNEQRPLISSPLVRALLTLLGLVYRGLGRLVLRDDVAEMLVILSCQSKPGETLADKKLVPEIDPVRAGLIADYCYHIDPEKPALLPVETFPRWDRLGNRATAAYGMIRDWIEQTQILLQQQRLTSPILVLDRGIKQFISKGNYLAYDQMSELRELMETAQHFWEIDRRVRQYEPISDLPHHAISEFIQLLRRGTITANPRPLRYFGNKPPAVTLSNIFQYRSLRSFHRWQFWLDAGSMLWEKGGSATLFAAPLFLREWTGRSLTSEEELEMDQARLRRILKDLLGRVGEGVFLCHSDLGVTGTEHAGPLLTLVHSSRELIYN